MRGAHWCALRNPDMPRRTRQEQITMAYPSHTTINVAKKKKQKYSGVDSYIHFFRVDIDRAPDYCAEQIKALKKKFAAPQYEVTVTYWECIGKPVNEKNEVQQ